MSEQHEEKMAEISGGDNSTAIKMLCTFLFGIVLAGAGAFFAYPHDLPTKSDVASNQAEVQSQMTALQAQVNEETIQLTNIRIWEAKISYKLGIPDPPQ